jgi:hypothetical protein
MSLRSRLEAAEAQVGRVVAGYKGITLLGGIETDASYKIALVGPEFIERDDGELPPMFRKRVLTAARAAKEHAVFGGLPPMPIEDERHLEGRA